MNKYTEYIHLLFLPKAVHIGTWKKKTNGTFMAYTNGHVHTSYYTSAYMGGEFSATN